MRGSLGIVADKAGELFAGPLHKIIQFMLANCSSAFSVKGLSATTSKLPLTLIVPLSSDLGKRGRVAEIYNQILMAAAIH